MPPNNLNKDNLVPLLPFGETLRPLVLASNLKGSDLKFVLQKRGIFVKTAQNEITVPIITSILLSPKEFDILKNRLYVQENAPKITDAKVDWHSAETILKVLPDETEVFVKNLVDDNSSYRLIDCSVNTISPDEVKIDCSIERQDWTKDAFSSTSYHDCSFSISRDSEKRIVTYRTETTVSETKDLMNNLQNALHSHFRQQGVIPENTPIQRVLANYFLDSKTRYEFLNTFIAQVPDIFVFQKIVDIDAGIEHSLKKFPEDFNWLKGNIDIIDLRGKGIHLTEILKLGEIGVLVFGEIEAVFEFEYKEAKGTCTIRYGFPNFYKKRLPIEFEVKIVDLALHPDFIHVSKKHIGNYLLQKFQENKHSLFQDFVAAKKTDTRKRDQQNQYEFEGESWD